MDFGLSPTCMPEGIEMSGGMMQKLIERNSTIPTNKSQAQVFIFCDENCMTSSRRRQDFTTAEDYQDYVEIKADSTNSQVPQSFV